MTERIEVVTRRERRRRWRVEDKLAIVAETMAPGATVGEVAGRYDVSPNLLYTWRRMAQGRPARPAGAAQLVPVRIAPAATLPRSARATAMGRIEIGLPGGIRVKVEADVTPERLASVLAILRR